MWIIAVLVLAAGGALGASSLIISKRPDAAVMLDKIRPFQGIIGVILLLWGAWGVINMLRSLGAVSVAPLIWIVGALGALTSLCLGFLLAYDLIAKNVLGGNTQFAAAAQRAQSKLAVYQGALGVAALVLAVLVLLTSLRAAA